MKVAIGIAAILALCLGIYQGAVWLRKDAKADLLRELVAAQAQRTLQDQKTKERISKEIEDEDLDALRHRACTLGMLPPDSCSQ